MKKYVIILVLTAVTLHLFAKSPAGGKVDPFIENKFQKEFGLLPVSWKVIDDVSIATYNEEGEQRQVYYFSDGEVFGYGKILSNDQLPAVISKVITERFKSGVIQTVYEFKTKDSPTRYFVRVVTPKHVMIISSNEFGDLGVAQKLRTRQPHL